MKTKLRGPRNPVIVAYILRRQNSGSHGDKRRDQSRNGCRKWKEDA